MEKRKLEMTREPQNETCNNCKNFIGNMKPDLTADDGFCREIIREVLATSVCEKWCIYRRIL